MSNKKSFYCWYLGFTEVPGPHDSDTNAEIVTTLVNYHEQAKLAGNQEAISKVTLTLSESGLTIVDIEIQHFKKKLFQKSQERIVNKIYTISYDSLVHVNNHRRDNRCTTSHTNNQQHHTDIVTLLTKSRSKSGGGGGGGEAKKKRASSENPTTSMTKPQQLPVFYLHAFRFDSDETANKMEHCLSQFRANYFSRLKPKIRYNAENDSIDENEHLRNKKLSQPLILK